jgi:hypothetical protein
MLPQVNYLAVLVSGVAIFILGGLWYSPLLFAKPWMSLQGKTREQMMEEAKGTPMALMYLCAFICGILTAWALAIILNHFDNLTYLRGVEVAVLCWLGFTAATSFASAIFYLKPKALWAIDCGYNLVAFVIAALILTCWR